MSDRITDMVGPRDHKPEWIEAAERGRRVERDILEFIGVMHAYKIDLVPMDLIIKATGESYSVVKARIRILRDRRKMITESEFQNDRRYALCEEFKDEYSNREGRDRLGHERLRARGDKE